MGLFGIKMNNTEVERIEASLDRDWVVSLENRLSDTNSRDRYIEPTIYRVSDILKSVDPQAYEPLIVSLGPYHRDKPHLQAMNHRKRKSVKFVLEQNPGVALADYLDRIKDLETIARDVYSEEVEMTSNSFAEMMLLDGCFVIHTIMEGHTRRTRNVVVRDIFMLENQLPFILLETLFESAFGGRRYDFRYITFEFICMHFSSNLKRPSDNDFFHHIIHLFLSCIDPTTNHYNGNVRDANPEEGLPVPELSWIPSATVFNKAGIRFERKETDKGFLDITFHNGKLEIPQLQIDGLTNSLLRNLVAYEQYSTDSKFHVTSYVVLMDYLINTAADVELLQHHEIIISSIGDNQEIATLFNKLGTYVSKSDDSYLKGVVIAMKKHYDTRYSKWRARLNHNYFGLNHDFFSNPWAVISLFGALCLFVLTVIQSTFTILSYFLPPK
ncbi:UPF0481 protein At3g47200-like [Zingiber officinale]|uniref:Uncharacterized protein n=1 Tax=Zingiber officinale TaxID=94328 RepID=A0A8J5GVY1_ZINOF|nr:UPF0481 protein At3g47200-like [Zingiber officinale]KAG6512618.1 hypothetical protein ZIOFF_030743 [Zingiber officinale]